jgi:outer membrane protein assembly factor BamB
VYVVDEVLSRAAALDVRDGHVLWDVPIDSAGIRFTIAADGASLYVGTRARHLVALDAATGAERWRRDFGATAGVLAGAATDGATVFVSGSRAVAPCAFCLEEFTAAVAATDGSVVWQHLEGDSASDAAAAPTLAGDLLVTSGLAHGVVARVRQTGATRWRVTGAERYSAMTSPPLVLGDTVVIGDGPILYAVRLGSGAPLYSTELRSSIRYVAACGGKLLVSRQALDVVDVRTHRLLGTWLNDEYGADGFVTSGFAVSGDRAVVTTNRDIVGLRCR